MGYEVVEEYVETVGPFSDDFEVTRPKFRCRDCSRAIPYEFYTGVGDCYQCYQDELPIGDALEKVTAFGVYITDRDHQLKNAIYDLKDNRQNVSLFGEILEWEVDEQYDFGDPEILVVPPSGSSDSDAGNHMVPVGQNLSERTGIPFEDCIYKTEDYPSQKRLSFEERLENVRGKIGCRHDQLEADKALVIDDIATSCATVAETARVLAQVGVQRTRALVIARDTNTGHLEHAEVLRRVE